MKSQGSYHGNR